ncbi:MAG: M48 family metallopeptidase [Candidatus Nitrotoga sp.]|jgi:predicted Zn-dependent protease|nr:M48 family metallopeptidase [Nitrosomonadales bacterium]
MFNNRIYSAVFISLSLAAFGGCKTTTSGGAVGVKGSQLMLVSSQQLEQVAAQSYNKLKAEAEQKGVLNQDRAMLERLLTITNRIKPHTSTFRSDAPSWKWETNIISDKQLNAFCMPGGKIIFYSGLINELKLTDDEVAIVMGHEIAHALREHSREQVSQAMVANTTINVGAALLGLGGGAADLVGSGYQALVATKFSRTDETEADQIGLELSARAGYDPRAGVSLWQKMMNGKSGQRSPELLSSHPADATRIRQIEKLLPTVMPLYETARK